MERLAQEEKKALAIGDFKKVLFYMWADVVVGSKKNLTGMEFNQILMNGSSL